VSDLVGLALGALGWSEPEPWLLPWLAVVGQLLADGEPAEDVLLAVDCGLVVVPGHPAPQYDPRCV